MFWNINLYKRNEKVKLCRSRSVHDPKLDEQQRQLHGLGSDGSFWSRLIFSTLIQEIQKFTETSTGQHFTSCRADGQKKPSSIKQLKEEVQQAWKNIPKEKKKILWDDPFQYFCSLKMTSSHYIRLAIVRGNESWNPNVVKVTQKQQTVALLF